MLFFIYNPSSELCVQMRMESRDRKEERSQKLHLKPCFPTFGLKQEIIYQPPNCHLFTQLYSPTGLPPSPVEVSLDFPLSLGMQLKKTFIWMQKTMCSPFVRLAGSQSNETGFSIWAKWFRQSLNVTVLQNHVASNAKCAVTKTRCKIREKFCSKPSALKNNGSTHSWSNLNNTLQIFQMIFSHLPQTNHFMTRFHDFISLTWNPPITNISSYKVIPEKRFCGHRSLGSRRILYLRYSQGMLVSQKLCKILEQG